MWPAPCELIAAEVDDGVHLCGIGGEQYAPVGAAKWPGARPAAADDSDSSTDNAHERG